MTCDEVRDLAPAFVLGSLERDEEAAVRDHLATCPEAHAETEQLGGVVPYLAETLEPVEPPAGLKARILAAAAADLVAPAAAPIPLGERREQRAASAARRPARSWLLGLAAVLAIVALGAWNVVLQGRVSDADRYRQAVAAVLDLAARPGSQTAVLGPGTGETASGVAALGPGGEVVMAVQDLAPTSGPEVYEAWVIVGAAPIPIGSFQVGSGGYGVLTTSNPAAGEGAVLALTREPGPGATVPTGTMVVQGPATGPPS